MENEINTVQPQYAPIPPQEPKPKKKKKKFWMILGIIVAVIVVISVIAAVASGEKFKKEPDMEATVDFYESYGFGQLSVNFKNTSDKAIKEVSFYVIGYDAHDEKLGHQIKSYGEGISANSTEELDFYFLGAKKLDVYLINIYYDDGSEWGDKDASESTVVDKAPKLKVNVW